MCEKKFRMCEKKIGYTFSLFFWGRTMSLFIRGDYKLAKLQHRIELCAIYWHFLLIVWFVLFGLMLFT